ncbi:hypothetical protein [Sulfurimonas sp.]|uniref:hypothetical protein n=1 Tax=Sulfurimonas sp. TaxID=2022749 RepID=UPI003D10BE3D
MKNTLILSLAVAGLVSLTACSSDKEVDPTTVLINEINKQEKQDLETTIKVMKSFYKDTLMNVNSKDCAVQTTTDKDELEKAMILLSQKYCGKSGLFDNEMQVILNNVNVKKQINIGMNKIDNTQEYLDLGFDLPTATKMKQYGVSPQEADKIFAFIERNPRFSDEDYFYGMLESGVTTAAEFIDWTKAPLPSYKILEVVQLGVNLDEYKEWFKMRYTTPNQIKAFKEAAIKTPAQAREWYEVAKKLNDHNLASYDTIIAWKKLGIDNPEQIVELRKNHIYTPHDYEQSNKK